MLASHTWNTFQGHSRTRSRLESTVPARNKATLLQGMWFLVMSHDRPCTSFCISPRTPFLLQNTTLTRAMENWTVTLSTFNPNMMLQEKKSLAGMTWFSERLHCTKIPSIMFRKLQWESRKGWPNLQLICNICRWVEAIIFSVVTV